MVKKKYLNDLIYILAMENWGLAIYLEANFLFTRGVSSQNTEGAVVRIIAHEISHMVSFSLK